MGKKKPTTEQKPGPSSGARPLGVSLFGLLMAFAGILLALPGAEALLDGEELLAGGTVQSYLPLIVGGWSVAAALLFILLRRDGWLFTLIAAGLNVAVSELFVGGRMLAIGGTRLDVQSVLIAIAAATAAYLLTPAVKRLYRSDYGPTL